MNGYGTRALRDPSSREAATGFDAAALTLIHPLAILAR
jgi:hypothetical protein